MLGDDDRMNALVRSLLVIVLLTAVGAPTQALPAPRAVDRDPQAVRVSRILGRWLDERASAYASTDVRAARSLYTRASRAGIADAAMLRAYADRGLVVRRLTTQILSVELLDREGRLLRLGVEARFAGGMVRAGQARQPLPSGGVTRRVVTMVHVDGRWLVRGVRRG